MTINVGVDGAPLSVSRTGVGRYLSGLLGPARDANGQLLFRVLMYRARRRRPIDPIPEIDRPGIELVHQSLVRSRLVSSLARLAIPVGLTSVLRDQNVHLVTRYWGTSARSRSVVLVYDLVWESAPWSVEPGFLRRLAVLARRAIGQGRVIAVMSRAVEAELHQVHPETKNRTVVVPPGPTGLPPVQTAYADRVLAHWGLEPGFALVVGTIEPRKNIDRLLGAWQRLPTKHRRPRLVIAGRPGWGSASAMQRLEASGGDVRVLSPNDRELAALYSRSAAFIFPSLYEGFGLPLLEAMEANLPIACSDIPVFREVAGRAACYFDPTDEDTMADAIARCLDGAVPGSRQRLAAFCWARSGQVMARSLECAALDGPVPMVTR